MTAMRHATWGWTALFVLAFAYGLASFVDDWLFLGSQPLFLYNGAPMLRATDGYHFLDLARGVFEGRAAPTAVPLLSALTAWVAMLSGVGLETVACLVPPVVASLTACVYVLWGRTLTGNPGATLIAAVIGLSVPYWHVRANVGYLDTDCLNILLVGLGCWLFMRFETDTGQRRFVWLGLMCAVLGVFVWWWRAGAAVFAGLVACCHVLSLPFATTRAQRASRIALAALMACGLAAYLVGGLAVFPVWAVVPMEAALNHLHLVMHGEELVYPSVAVSIGELKPPDFSEISGYVGGWLPAFLVGMIGAGLAVWRRPRQCLYLLPLAVLGTMAFLSARFMLFLVPVVGIGVGVAVHEAWVLAAQVRRWRRVAQGAVALVALGVVSVPVMGAFHSATPPVFAKPEALLASVLREAPAGDTVVWAWWDYGYMLKYFSGRRPYFDGGSQDPVNTFTAAWALAAPDEAQARNLMRFFAARGPGALGYIQMMLGTPERTVEFLKTVFAEGADVPGILAGYGLQQPELAEFLFPEADVYVYLPMSSMDKAPWIYYFGRWDVGGGQGVKPVFETLPRSEYRLRLRSGRLVGGGTDRALSCVIHVGPDGVGVRRFDAGGEAAVVDIAALPHLFLVDGAYLDTTLFRLLFIQPNGTRHFRPVVYDSRFGGVWRVI
ncbi:hypothetical protein GGQ74_002337 [Desulfobaculum xiamenense]|uniref:Dolichyl-diphosphooligosaccharide--protein glycosyltransferase n=1 Tax=Desulfobaculum xiamenense TaxID=995050 RepID=A0A846QU27_9BACT|nr:STT3 domain-containing protein [Desulfobaculum xiamenense]NJB68664.1 hypothetical protein [Desulfobaculum xiamenense]